MSKSRKKTQADANSTTEARPSTPPASPRGITGDDKAGPSKQVATTEEAEGELWAPPAVAIPERPLQQAVKRAFDIGFSVACLAAGWPVLAAAAVAIKLDSPGPVFYKQVRVGQFGRPFHIYKFRSMVTDAERDGPRWARNFDNRVTRVGGLLRRSSVDELPQIWNVLKGDMSWIGPRPERPVFVARFRQQFDDYDTRHAVRPGLSGWAQVNGLRGNVSIAERTRFDVDYVRKFSLLLDVQCFLKTFSAVMAGE
jgi:exopolysaccharide biosynthesis polyprenyl glycosylphosphotransferase